MKKKNNILFILLATLFLTTPVYAVGTRDHLFVQGLVQDNTGTAINGAFSLTFRLYDVATGGSALWEEVQSLNFQSGVYSAELGSVTNFPSGLFDHETLFLGVQIQGDSELSPRSGLFSVPFAQQCEVAVTAQSLVNDIVTSANIAPASVTSSDIAAGAVGPAELASTNVTPGTYTLSTITVDADGRVTSASNGSVGSTASTLSSNTQGAITLNPFGTVAGNTGEVRFGELAASGTNYVGLKAPDAITTNQVWVLPAADGTSGQVLSTNGAGVLSWSSGAVGDITGVTAGSGLLGGGTSGDVALSADGPNIANLNASNLSSGTVADARLSSAVSLLGSSIDSSEITDGTVTNADINATANIGWAKIDKTGAVAGDIGAATASHTHATTDITGSLTDAQVNDNLTISSSGSVAAAALTGALTDAQIPNNITIDFATAASTATSSTTALTATALSSNGSNCSAGSYPLGVDASGNSEGCTVAATGSVTSVSTGTGLTGGPITSTGTISIAVGGVSTTEILDSTITNADIHAGAAITGTKVSPDFGSQNVVTTGHMGAGTASTTNTLDVNGTVRMRSQAVTIADNGTGSAATLTLTPTASLVELTCNDTNNCTITMGESGINDGQIVRIVNLGTRTCAFSDTSGVSELSGAFTLGRWDMLQLTYVSDRWVETSRSNN